MADEQTTNTNQPTTTTTTPTEPITWDGWYGTLGNDHKALIDTHLTGLKETVKATRQERDELAKQLKALAGKAEKGSELEAQITQLQAQLTTQTQRAGFVEAAPAKGVTNIAAAWKLALADGLISKDGDTDWEALKKTYPELFAKADPPKAPDINSGHRTTVIGKSTEQILAEKRRTYGGI